MAKHKFLYQPTLLALSLALGAIPAAAQFSGAITTTQPNGTTINGNIYASKGAVFFTAGPQNSKASGLPDGLYYFQVTDPSSHTLLSNDPAACRQLAVSGGRIAGAYDPVTKSVQLPGTPAGADCAHASIINAGSGTVALQLGGTGHACLGGNSPDLFCDTPNPGGEYKLWLIAQNSAVSSCGTSVNPDQVSLSFEQKCAKTDNFKLALAAVSHVTACVFNDANGNGIQDPGELMISGWSVTARIPMSSYVTVQSDNQAGTSVTAQTNSTGCISFSLLGIPGNATAVVSLTENTPSLWTQTAPGNGTYAASGNPSASGPTTVVGAAPSAGMPASGGVINVNLGPGQAVTAPKFGNTDPQCPDCSVLGTVTLVNTATPNKLYTWGITKSVDAAEIDNVANGGTATFHYSVNVTHDSGSGSLLSGSFTIINADGANPSQMFNVTDATNDGGTCAIKDRGTGQYVSQVFNLTLSAFTEVTLSYRCTYSGAPGSAYGTNTVAATNVSNPALQYKAQAAYNFSGAAAIADGSVSIVDTLGGTLGTVSITDSSPKTFLYPYTFSAGAPGTCAAHDNVATFTANTTGATASASQSVKVCVKNPNPVTITTAPSPASVTLGSSPVTLNDSAVLAGGLNPSGVITFTLMFNGATIDTETVAVSGNGTYSTPKGYVLSGAGTVVGTYQWNASYSGDSNNSAASDTGNAGERATVVIAKPVVGGTIVGNRIADGAYLLGDPINVTATLSGAYNPTGTMTFSLYRATYPNPVIFCSQSVAVNGNGTYSKPTACTIPNDADVVSLQWSATYSGDSNNQSASWRVDFLTELN